MKKLAKILSLSLTLVMCTIILTACSVSIDNMKKKYEDDGYTVEVAEKDELAQFATKIDLNADDIEWGFIADKTSNSAMVICFKDVQTAEKAEGAIKTILESSLGSAPGYTPRPTIEVKRDDKVITIATSTTDEIDDENDIQKKYEDAGYTVEVATKEDLADFASTINAKAEDIEWGFTATKTLNIAIVACFKDAEKAEKTMEQLKTAPMLSMKLEGKVLYVASTDIALNAK